MLVMCSLSLSRGGADVRYVVLLALTADKPQRMSFRMLRGVIGRGRTGLGVRASNRKTFLPVPVQPVRTVNSPTGESFASSCTHS